MERQTPEPQPVDILDRLCATCPPELVHHIFSFTQREHASAASFFRLATRLRVVHRVESFRCFHKRSRSQSHMEYSVTNGDLPMVRWMLAFNRKKSHACSWSFLAMYKTPFRIQPSNLHVYRYFHTLLDVKHPLLEGTDAGEYHRGLHDKLREYATINSHTDLLAWLHASNLASLEKISYLDPFTVGLQFHLLEHAHSLGLLAASGSECLQHALRTDWHNALIYLLDTCGFGFDTWDDENDLPCVLPHLATARVLCDRDLFPADACRECLDRHRPSLGYWGAVCLYRLHRLDPPLFHGPDGGAAAARRCARDREAALRGVVGDALEEGQIERLEHMVSGFPEVIPDPRAIGRAMARGKVEAMQFAREKYPSVWEAFLKDLRVKRVKREVEERATSAGGGAGSAAPLVKFLEELPWLKGRILTRRILARAVASLDADLVEWALQEGGGGYLYKSRDVENWTAWAKRNEDARSEKALTEYAKRINGKVEIERLDEEIVIPW